MTAHRHGLVLLCAALSVGIAMPAMAQRPQVPMPEVPLNDPPGFDCARAATRVETVLCADRSLFEIDAAMNGLYRRLLAHSPPSARAGTVRSQRAWLRQRESCTDGDCAWKADADRISWISAALEARNKVLRRGVSRVGQCQRTAIDFIFPSAAVVRWMGAAYRGSTAVGFMNGVSQYSEDNIPAVHGARIGDPARVCLIHVARCGGATSRRGNMLCTICAAASAGGCTTTAIAAATRFDRHRSARPALLPGMHRLGAATPGG